MRHIFKTSALATALLLGSTAFARATIDIQNLPGYSANNLVSGFVGFLEQTPEVVEKLSANPTLSAQVFSIPAMQQHLMANIKPLPNNVRKQQSRLNKAANTNISDAARHELERTLQTLQRAKEDSEFAKYAASAENEGAIQQQGMAGHTGITPPIASEPSTYTHEEDAAALAENTPFAVANVNAIPTSDSLAPDANGWPKYLNAPAHCKPPSPQVSYLYEFRFKHEAGHPLRPSAAGRLSSNDNDTVIANYFYPYSMGGGDNRDIYLKANEALAIPFIAGSNVGIANTQYRSSDMDRIISLSDCPGDVGNPYNGNNLGKYCVGQDAHEDDRIYATANAGANSGNCRIEHGKRYFLNIQPTTAKEHVVDDSAENKRRRETMQQHCRTSSAALPKMCVDGSLAESSSICYHQADKGDVCIRQENGKVLINADGSTRLVQAPSNYHPQIKSACINKPCKVGALSIGGANPYRLKPVPYNGPCLQQGPFPLNYNSTTCGRSFNGYTCARDGSVTIECADPQNELDTVRVVQGCRTGANPAWLEGYGKPIHSRLQCRVTNIENAPTYDHTMAAQNPETYRQRYFFFEWYLNNPGSNTHQATPIQAGPYAPPSNAYGNNSAATTGAVQTTPAPKQDATAQTTTSFTDSIIPEHLMPQFPNPGQPDFGNIGISQPGAPDLGRGGINTSTSSSGGVNTSTSSSGANTPPRIGGGGGGSIGGGGIGGGIGGVGGGGGALNDLINEINRRNESIMRNLTDTF